MAATLMITIIVLTSALSRTPRTRIKVTASMITSAGRLNNAPVGCPGASIGGYASASGR